jgi:hypothetical protein
MYTINRNSDVNEGGAIPSSLAEGLKSKFASSLVDVELEEDNDVDDDDEDNEGSNQGNTGKSNVSTTSQSKNQSGNNNDDDNDDDSDVSSPLSYLAKTYGINIEEDEDFKDLDLNDDSIDTIKKFYDKREEKVKQSAVNELFEAAPIVKDLIEHLQKGGSISTWKEEKAIDEMDLSFEDKSDEEKTQFLIDVYKQKGISERRAKLLIEALKDDDEFEDEVEKEANRIKQALSEKINAKKQAEYEEQQRRQKEIEETVKTVTDIVKKGKLVNNYVIPESERKEFNNFILSEELGKKYQNLTYEQRLFLDYLIFKDFKIKGLENKQIQQSAGSPRVKLKSEGGGSGKNNSITLSELKLLMSK